MIHISSLTMQKAYLKPILFAVLLAALSTNAFAIYTVPCGDELNAVQNAIDAATFLGKNAAFDETNLEAKLTAAAAKIAQEKNGDAIDKLLDISDKATDLATAPKPKLDDAAMINIRVNEAISCVGGL